MDHVCYWYPSFLGQSVSVLVSYDPTTILNVLRSKISYTNNTKQCLYRVVRFRRIGFRLQPEDYFMFMAIVRRDSRPVTSLY